MESSKLENTTIPKIIHYCWFGGNSMPQQLKECMESWRILQDAGYTFVRWDESNCSFDENDFVKQAYQEKRWGFIGDYYRAKALYLYGGIYLDTDIIVKNTFDDLLDNECFMGFSCDCALCTAVIGAQKGSQYMKSLMNMYDNNEFVDEATVIQGKKVGNKYASGQWIPSNEYYTWHLLSVHPSFKLNNQMQLFDNICIYPKSFFELGSIGKKYYCRHENYNSWHEKKGGGLRKIKRKLERNEFFWIAYRHLKSMIIQRKSSFYKYRKHGILSVSEKRIFNEES